jgi:outer membrane lipoprotein LolB
VSLSKLTCRLRAGLLGAALALLGACASAPPAAMDDSLSGRLSVQVAAGGGETARGFSGQFELRGSALAGSLDLSGPLGATLARAHWSPGRYVLDDGRQAREFASLQDLAEQGLGEPLPLAALFDWLRARPWPGAAHRPRHDGVNGFEQLGWLIDLGQAGSGLLHAHRPAPPALTLRVRLDRGAAS